MSCLRRQPPLKALRSLVAMPHAHFASPRAQKQCDLFIWCHESRCMPISALDCTTQSSMGTPCPPPPIVLRSGSCHRFFRHPRRVRPRSFDPFARGPIHTQGRLLWCAPSLAAAPVPSCAALPALSSLFPLPPLMLTCVVRRSIARVPRVPMRAEHFLEAPKVGLPRGVTSGQRQRRSGARRWCTVEKGL